MVKTGLNTPEQAPQTEPTLGFCRTHECADSKKLTAAAAAIAEAISWQNEKVLAL